MYGGNHFAIYKVTCQLYLNQAKKKKGYIMVDQSITNVLFQHY